MSPADHRAAVRRRVNEGRVLTAVAVAAARKLPTFEDLARDLRGVSHDELAAALESLLDRGQVAVEKTPSPTNPLFDPPTLRYRPIGLQAGTSLNSKAGA